MNVDEEEDGEGEDAMDEGDDANAAEASVGARSTQGQEVRAAPEPQSSDLSPLLSPDAVENILTKITGRACRSWESCVLAPLKLVTRAVRCSPALTS